MFDHQLAYFGWHWRKKKMVGCWGGIHVSFDWRWQLVI